MATVTPLFAHAAEIPTCEHTDQVVDLVRSRARTEGCTESGVAGLSFFRHAAPITCSRGLVEGATLVAVLRGTQSVSLEGETFTADRMRYLVITRATSVETTVQGESPSEPYLALSLTFPPEVIVKALMALADAGATVPTETAPAFVSSVEGGVASALVRLLRTLDDRVERELIAPLIVEECALRLLRCEAAAAMRRGVSGADAIKVERAMRFMRTNAARPLSVPQIARHVGMSASHFAHRFSDVARVSPMRFLRQVRLSDARAIMLAEGSRPSEAASRVGFESTSHFTREFKRTYGASPAEYVRRFRN